MPALIAKATIAPTTLSAGVETDLLAGGSAGTAFSAPNGQLPDILRIDLIESGAVLVNAVKVYVTAVPGAGTPVSVMSSITLSASGTRSIVLRGFSGGLVRVTANSTAGASIVAGAVGAYVSQPEAESPFQVVIDGVVAAASSGGTISGNLAQSGGTFSLTGNAASTITTSSGNTAVDSAAALQLGTSSATSISVGQASVVANFVGGATIASAKAVTGLGAMAVEAASGSTLTVGAASNALALGQAAKVATMNGDLDLQGLIKGHVVDAGAAATSGTASSSLCTFTLSSGSAAYTLTNTKIATTSLLLCTVLTTGAVGAYILNAVPGSGSAVVTFSGNVGVNTKVAMLVLNAGA